MLRKIAVMGAEPMSGLQQALLNRLLAIVPSYVNGQYNESDISVSVDIPNKRIFGNAKLPKAITQDMQRKIEDNFREYATKLLGDNNVGWVIGVGFAMPPPMPHR